MSRCWYLTILLIGSCVLAIGKPPAHLADVIDRSQADPSLKGAHIGILIQLLDDGSTWYAQHDQDDFIPASTAKLMTAALVLQFMGPESQIPTRLLTDGKITSDGVLQGNLYLQGGGDPSLVPADLKAMARALATGNPAQSIPPVRRITGQLILDESCFPRSGPLCDPSWKASDLPWYYATPSCALSCHRNEVTVVVRGGTPGAHPKVTLDPPTSLFTVVNSAITRRHLRASSAAVVPEQYRIFVTGNLRPGAVVSEQISVPDPARLTKEQCLLALRQEGIMLENAQNESPCPAGQRMLLVEHSSAYIAELLQTMLKESDNHYAEQFRWILLGKENLQVPLDERYRSLLQTFAGERQLADWTPTLVDGSGLSTLSRITPDQMVHLLVAVAHADYFQPFSAALPIAGMDGTMEKRLIGTPAQGNARVKTGSEHGISAIAGYVTTAGGESLAVDIVVNGSNKVAARRMQDRILAYLAGIPKE